MSILANPTIRTWNLNGLYEDKEPAYAFHILFEKKEGYLPFLSGSRKCLDAFVDIVDYTNEIQDLGSNYTLKPGLISFKDERSAELAAKHLITSIKSTHTEEQASEALFGHVKSCYFGRKKSFEEEAAAIHGEENVTDEILWTLVEDYAADLKAKGVA